MSEKKKKTEEIVEEIVEEVPEEIESPVEGKKKVDVERFIARHLQNINELPNKAEAKYKAERILRNK